MRFVNDRQRKAVFSKLALGNLSHPGCDRFANINKFSDGSAKRSKEDVEDIIAEVNGIDEAARSFKSKTSKDFDNELIDILKKPTPSSAELYKQVSKLNKKHDTPFGDIRFAKQLREGGDYSSDILAGYEADKLYYYDEPPTAGSKMVVDESKRKNPILGIPMDSYKRIYTKVDRRPTKLDRAGNPIYESGFFNDVVMEVLYENTGESAEELVDEGKVAALDIESLSNKVKDSLLDQFDNSEAEDIKDSIKKGGDPEFDRNRSIVAEVASEERLYKDASGIVRDFLIERGFKKDDRGNYRPVKKGRDPADWGNEDEQVAGLNKSVQKKKDEFSRTADQLLKAKDEYVARNYVIEQLELNGEHSKVDYIKSMPVAMPGTNALDRFAVINILEGVE